MLQIIQGAKVVEMAEEAPASLRPVKEKGGEGATLTQMAHLTTPAESIGVSASLPITAWIVKNALGVPSSLHPNRVTC